MSEEQSLKQKTAKGLFWGGLSSSIQQLLGLIIGIIVTRMLSVSYTHLTLPTTSRV